MFLPFKAFPVIFQNQQIYNNELFADLEIQSTQLHGMEIKGALIPRIIDEIPILAVAATQARGKTIIRDASELRVKETDRIKAVVENLKKMGADVSEYPDGMQIEGEQTLHGAQINSYGDHRIAMAFAVAGLLARGKTIIQNADCVNISYPEFFNHLRVLSHD